MLKFFQKKVDPKEAIRKWQSQLRGEGRQIDRQVREIEREQKKVEKSIRECAKRGDMASCKTLGRELVQSRKTVDRLQANKAQLNSVSMHLGENLAMVRAVGHLEKSTEVMALVNKLIKTPEMMNTMREMSKEMMKAGLIEEMMNDTMESALDNDSLEEETEEEVDKVLAELAIEGVSAMPTAAKAQPAPQPVEAVAQEEDPEFDALQARLNAVRM
mmetsp:Transcript_38661/g.46811  ORF Transcript_38661/g.46811 Transcript_38661/m.46811 type:complete len:216 (+) Transcript_38661:377-1024(+)|eukprot:CAMPEP_0197854664 /NCGR_PEP_ID=MMETSP1438-20131217/25087_1 /TAXON_ID=1461541 /ORGANISM="Pterosperma sp., Strain CCMP1384" /LENGTH=215 /DNA_ID=CAMNT_0043469489 /DNA_START=376 /DNA_END=1023 /DNA_ORIENTATION=-